MNVVDLSLSSFPGDNLFCMVSQEMIVLLFSIFSVTVLLFMFSKTYFLNLKNTFFSVLSSGRPLDSVLPEES